MLDGPAGVSTERRLAWSIFAFAALLNVLSCLQYPYVDEPFILNNIVHFLEEGTLIPTHFGYPTLFSYLGVLPTIIGKTILGSAGIVESYSDLIGLHRAGSYLGVLPARLVSAILGALTVLVTTRLGVRLFGGRAGLAAGLLLAVSPMQIVYAGRALGDIASAFFATLCIYFAFRAKDNPDRRLLVMSAFFGGVAAAAKYSGGLAVIATVTVWGWQLIQRRDLRAGATVGLLLPVAAIAGLIAGCPGWLIEPGAYWEGLRGEMLMMSTGHRGIAAAPFAGPILHWLSAEPLMLVLLVAGSIHLLAKRGAAEGILLTLILLAFANVGRYPKADAHYLLFLYPAICLSGGYLVSGLVSVGGLRARPMVSRTVSAGLAAALLASRVPFFHGLITEDSRLKMKAWVVEHIEPGRAILMDPSYTPRLGSEGFELVPLSLETSADPSYEYVVISSWWYERYTETYGSALVSVPDDFAEISRFYFNLLQDHPQGWTRLADFATGNGPRVTLLKRQRL